MLRPFEGLFLLIMLPYYILFVFLFGFSTSILILIILFKSKNKKAITLEKENEINKGVVAKYRLIEKVLNNNEKVYCIETKTINSWCWDNACYFGNELVSKEYTDYKEAENKMKKLVIKELENYNSKWQKEAKEIKIILETKTIINQ